MAHSVKYGVMLPHFGRHTTPERLREAGPLIERLGFDSVWVRDHVVYAPHSHEDPDRTFIDAFITLSTIGARTSKVALCSAVLIPHRHPILTATMLASLDFVSGRGRVIAGLGIGNFDGEFAAIGAGEHDRRDVLEEYVGIMRKLWTGWPVRHNGRYYSFEGVQIKPVPRDENSIPIWYGGNSSAAVRRAVEYCDGWIASRMPISTLRRRIERLYRLAAERDREAPDFGIVPYAVPARTVGAALRRLESAPVPPEIPEIRPSIAGYRESANDLAGVAVIGPAHVMAESVTQLEGLGTTQIVFDLRLCFEDWEEQIASVGEEVLPLLRGGGGPAV